MNRIEVGSEIRKEKFAVVENFRKQFAAVVFGLTVMLLVFEGACAAYALIARHKHAVAAQHEETAASDETTRAQQLGTGTTGDIPAGTAARSLGVYLDSELVAIVSIWPHGEMQVVTPLTDKARLDAVIKAALPAERNRLFVTSHCTP